MRALKLIGTAIAAAIVVIGLLLAIGIPFNFLTSTIQARVEQQTGYRLTVGGATRIGLWPSLNVTLNDVTLQDPKERDSSDRLTMPRVQADITLKSLWSGQPEITELDIVRPILNLPLRRERSAPPLPSSQPAASAGDTDAAAFSIDRVTVSDGTMVFSNLHDRVESRIEGINANAVIAADRTIAVTGHARAGGHPLTVEIKAVTPAPPLARQNIPVDLRLEAPGVLQSPLSAKAELRLNGAVVMINGLSGALGDGAFNGWASVDLASKPLVKLDLDFQRLDIPMAGGSHGAGDVAALEQCTDRPHRTELCRRPGQALRGRPDHRRRRISRRPRSRRRWPAALSSSTLPISAPMAARPTANSSSMPRRPAPLTRCTATLPACARCRCCRARPASTSSTASCRRS